MLSHTTLLLLLVLFVLHPCQAQDKTRWRDLTLQEGVSCKIPMNWIVSGMSPTSSPPTESKRPTAFLLARPAEQQGFTRGRHMTTLIASKWASIEPVKPIDPKADPLDASETLPIRQMLALEGFGISKAWLKGKIDKGVQVMASTYVCALPEEAPWIVETTTWQDQGMTFAVQIRYPEKISAGARALLSDIKNSVRFREIPQPAFVSGYVMPEGLKDTSYMLPDEEQGGEMSTSVYQSDSNKKYADPAPTPAPESSADIMRKASGSLVLVEGKEKSGSGFVCNFGGQKFMVTNAHVLSGNSGVKLNLVDRSPIQVGAGAMAVGHDIVRLAVTSTATAALEVLDNAYVNLSAGDEVLVLGNAGGARVVNPIEGKVVGIGPDLVEVDAPFVPGNSGSPIIQKRTGKVIGVATYVITRELDTLADPTKEKKIRRFGYRLDGSISWQPIVWSKFNAEADAVKRSEGLTMDLANLRREIAVTGGLQTRMQQNVALRRAVEDYIKVAKESNRASSADILRAKQSFLSTLKVISMSDMANLRSAMTYDYFQRKVDEEREVRIELTKVFDALLNMQTEPNSGVRRDNNNNGVNRRSD